MRTIAIPQALLQLLIACVLALALAAISLVSASAALQVSVSAFACPSADSLIAAECTPAQGVSVEVIADGESSGPLTTHEDGFAYADAAPGAIVTVTMLGGGPVGYSVVANPIEIPAMQEGSAAVFVFVPLPEELDNGTEEEIEEPPFTDEVVDTDPPGPVVGESYGGEAAPDTGGQAAAVTSLPSTGSGTSLLADTNSLVLAVLVTLVLLVVGGAYVPRLGPARYLR